jgi:hypothetical protein
MKTSNAGVVGRSIPSCLGKPPPVTMALSHRSQSQLLAKALPSATCTPRQRADRGICLVAAGGKKRGGIYLT